MTLIAATLCPEGIALAADSKCTVSRCWMDSEAMVVKREQMEGPPIDVLVITQDGGRWFRKKDIVV